MHRLAINDKNVFNWCDNIWYCCWVRSFETNSIGMWRWSQATKVTITSFKYDNIAHFTAAAATGLIEIKMKQQKKIMERKVNLSNDSNYFLFCSEEKKKTWFSRTGFWSLYQPNKPIWSSEFKWKFFFSKTAVPTAGHTLLSFHQKKK